MSRSGSAECDEVPAHLTRRNTEQALGISLFRTANVRVPTLWLAVARLTANYFFTALDLGIDTRYSRRPKAWGEKVGVFEETWRFLKSRAVAIMRQ